MHSLMHNDYPNEIGPFRLMLGTHFDEIDLSNTYVDDDALFEFVMKYRAKYKMRTVWERYIDPKSPQSALSSMKEGENFQEWYSNNGDCVKQLDELVNIFNTTTDMTEFRGAYNELWYCMSHSRRGKNSLWEIKPEDGEQKRVVPKEPRKPIAVPMPR
ncbi:MAG TPA: hypothetical protein DCY07_00855 [Rhodospirillaceae bacterium]|nr:hypothetical protein [Rhodospirillaceae bacterium]